MQSKNEEQELIELCQKGNKEAFAKLVRTYQQMVFNFLYRLIPDWMDLEDLAQDVWIKVYRSIHNIKNTASFKTWLHRIAVNTYYDKMRKRKNYKEVSIDDDSDGKDSVFVELKDTKMLPEELLLDEEFKKNLELEIKNLPEKYKMVIIMRDVQNLTYDEISNILEISLGTVKSRIARAREKLVVALSGYLREVEADVS